MIDHVEPPRTMAEFEQLCQEIAMTYVFASVNCIPEDEEANAMQRDSHRILDMQLNAFFTACTVNSDIRTRMKPWQFIIHGSKTLYLIPPDLSGNEHLKNLVFIQYKGGAVSAVCLRADFLKDEIDLLQTQMSALRNLWYKIQR